MANESGREGTVSFSICRSQLRLIVVVHSMISGGEKQRLAVARLLLKDSPILFFDEAVSRT